MDTATEKLVATKDVSGDVDLSESETWSFQEEAVTGKPMHPANKTAREFQKLKEKHDHTIFSCLQPQFTIRKQFSRSSGKSTDENMTTLWMIWM